MIQRLLFWVGVLALLGGLVLFGFQWMKTSHSSEDVTIYPPDNPMHAFKGERLDMWIGLNGELDMTNPEEKPPTIKWRSAPAIGKKVGILTIPRVGVGIPIWEGTQSQALDRGMGHHPTTALPGEDGIVVLAGHRETAMEKAGELREGDPILLQTSNGTFTYQVISHWITDADDRTVVVNEKGVSRLKMYTCYPFRAGASTKKRYVIEAELTGSILKK